MGLSKHFIEVSTLKIEKFWYEKHVWLLAFIDWQFLFANSLDSSEQLPAEGL